MGQELLRALNAAAISWHGGAQLVWTGTSYNANSSSMKFRVATAAPGPPVTNLQKAVFDLIILCNLDLNGLNYDASRVLGLNTTRVLFLPYDASQSVNGVLSPAFVDLQTIQVLQLRSNIAKRFFQKQGPGSSTQKPLSLTNILFEIPTEPNALGSTLT